MQAIARANRVNEGKNNGLIVDYCGILKHLRRALATFAGAEAGGPGTEVDPARPDDELLAELAEAIALVRSFLDDRSAPLDDVIVDEAIETEADEVRQAGSLYDISQVNFERLRQELARSPAKRSTVQNLRHAVERRLLRLLQQNPLRTDLPLQR